MGAFPQVDAFVSEFKNEILSQTPADILFAVSSDMALMQQVQGFGDDVQEGLEALASNTGGLRGLEARLRSRTGSLLRLAAEPDKIPQHVETLEPILEKFVQRVLVQGRQFSGIG